MLLMLEPMYELFGCAAATLNAQSVLFKPDTR